jgi:uracil-DNA glycosylase
MLRTRIQACSRCERKFFAVREYVPLKTLPEADDMFAGFEPVAF